MQLINKARFFVIAIFLCILIGCASSGNQQLAKQNNTSINQEIVDGRTSKHEVEALLGQPDNN